jgi:hypothetical protein
MPRAFSGTPLRFEARIFARPLAKAKQVAGIKLGELLPRTRQVAGNLWRDKLPMKNYSPEIMICRGVVCMVLFISQFFIYKFYA